MEENATKEGKPTIGGKPVKAITFLVVATVAAVAVGVWLTWWPDMPVYDTNPCQQVSLDEMVTVGDICVDKYEASVWDKHPVLHDGTEVQFGLGGPFPDEYPCSVHGNDCAGKVFAVSKPGVKPATVVPWHVALMACLNVGKRLLTNAEWQAAAMGTPDPEDGVDDGMTECNVEDFPIVPTGSRSKCVSAFGVHDMVGNVEEWVADWMQRIPEIIAALGTYPEDVVIEDPEEGFEHLGETFNLDLVSGIVDRSWNSVFGRPNPAALLRGGFAGRGTDAGVFAVWASSELSALTGQTGFRCGRNL